MKKMYTPKLLIVAILLNLTLSEANLKSSELSGPNVCEQAFENDESPEQEVYQNDQTWACNNKLCEMFYKRAEKTLINQEVSSPKSTRCCDGYIKNSAGNGCEKLCENCINGNCVSRNQCECYPGYEGASCDVAVVFINGKNEWSNMIEFDFHFKAQKITFWICASVLTLLTLVIAINICFGRSQPKSQTSDVKDIANPNNYSGNIVLAAASTCKPKMNPGIHCVAAAQWTRPSVNRNFLDLKLPINSVRIEETKVVHSNEKRDKSESPKIKIEDKAQEINQDDLAAGYDLPSPFEPRKNFLREYSRLNSIINFTENEKDLKC